MEANKNDLVVLVDGKIFTEENGLVRIDSERSDGKTIVWVNIKPAQHSVHWTLRLRAWLKNKIGLGLRQ